MNTTTTPRASGARVLTSAEDARAWREHQAEPLRRRAAELQRRALLAAKTGRNDARLLAEVSSLRKQAAKLAA